MLQLKSYNQEYQPFWENLKDFGNAKALLEGDISISYEHLGRLVDEISTDSRPHRKKLIFLFLEPSIAGIACYLGLLKARHAVFLCPRNLENCEWLELLQAYKPAAILHRGETPPYTIPNEYNQKSALLDHHLYVINDGACQIASSLGLLISTSGSTSKRKLVRLSYENIASAAIQVRIAQDIEAADRAITALPLHHVYGLSVVHSHLNAGSSIVLNRCPIISKDFWRSVKEHCVTTLASISYTFEFMQSANISHDAASTISKLTHSTTAMHSELAAWIACAFPDAFTKKYLMYGQTEACGRISVLPASDFVSKPHSVGSAVPFGRLTVSSSGEILYSGPNVMLGYASKEKDLACEEAPQKYLHTGDVGKLDECGHLVLTGRINRMRKMFGQKVDLDEIEAFLRSSFFVSASFQNNKILLSFRENNKDEIAKETRSIAHKLQIPWAFFLFKEVTKEEDFQTHSSRKADYVSFR